MAETLVRWTDTPRRRYAIIGTLLVVPASLTWLQSYPTGWTSTASLLRMGPLAGGYGYVPGCDTTSKPQPS